MMVIPGKYKCSIFFALLKKRVNFFACTARDLSLPVSGGTPFFTGTLNLNRLLPPPPTLGRPSFTSIFQFCFFT